MNCYNIRNYLEKLAAGEIKGSLERQLLEHLQSCPGCLGEYQEMRQVLEMNQEPGFDRASYFNPVWRQRVRQDAFQREAGRRSFFGVFKANAIIPALGALAVLAVFGVFNIFDRFTPKATIDPLITRYSPAMSSTIGIPLRVKLINYRGLKEIAYHWSTEYGQFLFWDGIVTELGPEARTQANTKIEKRQGRVLCSGRIKYRLSTLSSLLNKMDQFLVEFIAFIIEQSVTAIFKGNKLGVSNCFVLFDSQWEQAHLVMEKALVTCRKKNMSPNSRNISGRSLWVPSMILITASLGKP
jgi:hypothetical protein